jgi:ubiquinone/menaquinone biosynthesis C-methylase UbiE
VNHDPAQAFFRAEVDRVVGQELEARGRLPLDGARIADLGCGFGFWLARYREWGARASDLFAVDLNPDRVAIATQACAGCNAVLADARHLPFQSGCFDIVSQFTLFSSILGFENRALIAGEMMRILRPGGLIISYDFFAPNLLNRRTRPLRRRELRRLFPNSRMEVREVTLAPPLARAALRLSTAFARRLGSIPLLKTHYVTLIEPGTGP